jgi:phenylalanyl-tRNA synthetase alpha chain
MKEQLEAIRDAVLKAVAVAATLAELEEIETSQLGRRSEFAAAMKSLGALSDEERREMGQFANEIKRTVTDAVEGRRAGLERAALAAVAESEWIDVTRPGTRPAEGHLHVVSQAIAEITRTFERMGFSRARHPEAEWDWYAFEALNMPSDHPARDEWETFFLDAPVDPELGRMVLTPHTTSSLVREIQKGVLPLRSMTISKTYRRQIDMTHVPMFHQFEGALIDRKVAVTHLRGVLDSFVKSFFGANRKTRLRPFHFRFTEPSFEIDISCGICDGSGVHEGAKCRTCKEGWVELGGAGMIHPNVLKAAGLNPEEWSGLAFGWGVERTMMMRTGVKLPDMRDLYRNDLRFLEQF